MPPEAASSPSKRFFTLDAPRDQPGQPFGCKLETRTDGLIVRELNNQETDIVALWNERCRTTFPQDALQPGDVLVAVNHIDCTDGGGSMIRELSRAAELFVLVRRET